MCIRDSDSTNTSMPLEMIEGANAYYEYTKTLSKEEAYALTAGEGSKFREMVGLDTPDDYTLVYTCIEKKPYFDTLAPYVSLYPASQKPVSYTHLDKIFFAAAMAANKARIPLAKMAVQETGMGVVEDKVIKNHYASEYIYNAYRDTKTCGVIEEDKAYGIKKIAEPIGLIAAVIPTTNPTSTAIFKTRLCLKTRNAIIISPHPRAKESTIAAAKVVYEAAVAARCV